MTILDRQDGDVVEFRLEVCLAWSNRLRWHMQGCEWCPKPTSRYWNPGGCYD